ncbi:uncharacterized protein LOC134783433 isoform X2 [Penaeus indicus]|uniref:uncharacterized protein LOC134783433 isoform X2 n=1 Tax=Penaeus indicus TaxID=29960 RepID=UPI00300D97A9
MRSLALTLVALVACTHAALLDHDHDHHHHDFELATGEESKIANARINELFEGLARSDVSRTPADMPTMTEIPTDITFSCAGKLPGYYADVQYDCQLYHVCEAHDMTSYLCPNGTIFNQEIFACDWWFSVDCSAAPNFYHLNEEIYKDPEVEETAEGQEQQRAKSATAGWRSEQTFSFGKARVEDPFAAIFQGLSVPDKTPASSAKVESVAAPKRASFFIPVPAPAQNRERTASQISDYLPPTQDYLPPSDDYLPPTQDYLPPSDDYLPPTQDYLPPSGDYLPPSFRFKQNV